jgi:CBS domain-containing protein
MRTAGHYESAVVSVLPDAGMAEVAELMDRHAVGSVVVVDAAQAPLGIITDRDLLCRVVAGGLDPAATRARDVMTPDPVTGRPEDPLDGVLEIMASRGVRRLPIVRDGRVVGVVALDDLVAELGRELSEVREALRIEVLGARRRANRRKRREELEAAVEALRGQASQLGHNTRVWLEREIDVLRDLLRRKRD